ncbi:MAG: hypothetical protein IKJ19_00110 [Clostridia bacterium]|nr:hypothetical protein [Clostridia bacterium]
MKKKIFKVAMVALLSACALFPTFANVKDTNASGEKIETYKLINGFNTVQDAYNCEYLQAFGITDLNTDAKYVTEGKGSVRLNVYGRRFEGTAHPLMKIPFVVDKVYDLSRLKNITFDLFNESGKDCTMEVALEIGTKTTLFQIVSLKQGLNNVKLDYNVKGMAGGFDLTQGKNIVIKLPREYDQEKLDQNVYYLDKVEMNMSAVVPTPYEVTYDENEICSFDKPYQEFMTMVNGVSTADGLPILSINNDPAYTATLSGKSLRVEYPTAQTSGGAVYWSFAEDILYHFDWEALGAQNKYIVFDVYCDSINNQGYSIQIWRARGDRSDNRIAIPFTAKSKTWTTVRVSIADLVKPASDGYIMLGYNADIGEYNYQRIMMVTGKNYGENFSVYFDNFRLEDAE